MHKMMNILYYNHVSNNNQTIERENSKRKTKENTSPRPLKIIRTELL